MLKLSTESEESRRLECGADPHLNRQENYTHTEVPAAGPGRGATTSGGAPAYPKVEMVRQVFYLYRTSIPDTIVRRFYSRSLGIGAG